jgi:hypothetical protein
MILKKIILEALSDEELLPWRRSLKKGDKVLLQYWGGGDPQYLEGEFEYWERNPFNYNQPQAAGFKYIYYKNKIEVGVWTLENVYPPDYKMKNKLTNKGKELQDIYDQL